MFSEAIASFCRPAQGGGRVGFVCPPDPSLLDQARNMAKEANMAKVFKAANVAILPTTVSPRCGACCPPVRPPGYSP